MKVLMDCCVLKLLVDDIDVQKRRVYERKTGRIMSICTFNLEAWRTTYKGHVTRDIGRGSSTTEILQASSF